MSKFSYQNFRKKLKENSFFSNVAIVAGGNAAAKLIGILCTPIITRLYTPSDYGVFSVFISVAGIAGSLATLRYAVTIPLPASSRIAENILKLCFLITLSLSLLFALGILFFGNSVTRQFDSAELIPYLWLLPIIFLGQGFYEALNNWAVRIRDYKLITRTKLSQSISSSALKIGFGTIGVAPLGLFIGHITQEAAGITSIVSRLRKKSPAFFNRFSLPGLKYAARRYRKFPLVQSWSQLLLALGAQLPVLMIGAYYGAEVVGVFGLAVGMVNLPMDLIGQAVAQVYYGEIAKLGKSKSEQIYRLSVSITKKMFFVALIPVVILVLFGPWIFSFVFGTEWLDSGVYARMLATMILFRFISSPIMNCLNILEKQGLQLLFNITRVLLVGITFYFSYIFNLTPDKAILFYSVIISLFYCIVVLKIFSLLKRNTNENV